MWICCSEFIHASYLSSPWCGSSCCLRHYLHFYLQTCIGLVPKIRHLRSHPYPFQFIVRKWFMSAQWTVHILLCVRVQITKPFIVQLLEPFFFYFLFFTSSVVGSFNLRCSLFEHPVSIRFKLMWIWILEWCEYWSIVSNVEFDEHRPVHYELWWLCTDVSDGGTFCYKQ